MEKVIYRFLDLKENSKCVNFVRKTIAKDEKISKTIVKKKNLSFRQSKVLHNL